MPYMILDSNVYEKVINYKTDNVHPAQAKYSDNFKRYSPSVTSYIL